MSVWIKIPTVGSGGLGSERVGIVLGNYPDAYNINWELHDDGQMRIYWNSGEIDQLGTTDLRDYTWHHIVWVRDKAANRMYMYIDGVLEKTITTAGSDVTCSTAPKIGADNRSGPPNYHGVMDEVRVSNVARSADWLWACYQNQKPNSTLITYSGSYVPPSNLIAYWNFDSDMTNIQGNTDFDGTAVGTAVISGSDVKVGTGALKIDNTIGFDYVDITSTVMVGNVPTTNTVVAWYKYDDIGNDGSDIRNFVWETAGSGYALSFGIQNSGAIKEVQWFTKDPSTGRPLIGSPGVNDNQWHHAAVVIDEVTERLKFYHDGSILDNVTISGLALDVAGAVSGFHIGDYRAGNGDRNWDGYIDDMAIYDVELNSDQIQALFTGVYLGQNVNAGNVMDIVP